MAISDYVRFDQRSMKIIDEFYNDRLKAALEKYNYDKNSILYLEEKMLYWKRKIKK